MPNTWMLRQNFYGDKSKGTNQIDIETFIQETNYIICPYGHIEKEIFNSQYQRFIGPEMKCGDVILIPLKHRKQYIKVLLEDEIILKYHDTGYYYLSDTNRIELRKVGITQFKPHVRKIKHYELCNANFDMRKFPKCTFCKLQNGEPK